jgi:hypothetical protein
MFIVPKDSERRICCFRLQPTVRLVKYEGFPELVAETSLTRSPASRKAGRRTLRHTRSRAPTHSRFPHRLPNSHSSRTSASSRFEESGNRRAQSTRRGSFSAPSTQSSTTAPPSEQLHRRHPEGSLRYRSFTPRTRPLESSRNNLSTRSHDLDSRLPSALRHVPAVWTRCE